MNYKWDDELISIIMPTYNSSATIEESINSVLNQTYTRWELIITDDCSKDDTEMVVKKYNDKRIIYERFEHNQGVSAARNNSINLASGRYIAFLDSDDIWSPHKLSRQLRFMRENCIGFSYTHYRQFVDDVDNCGKEITTRDSVDYKSLLKGNDIACLTVMIDRDMFRDIHMDTVHHEDYATWLNLLKNGGVAYSLHEDLARYRKGKKNALTHNKWKSMIWTWNVYYRNQNLPALNAIYYMIYYVVNGIRKHC